VTLLNLIADKYGYCDSERAFSELENQGISPEPAIETALHEKYVVSCRDDWGRTLVITPRGLERIGRILPGTYFNTWSD
jgi:hypothetical protein